MTKCRLVPSKVSVDRKSYHTDRIWQKCIYPGEWMDSHRYYWRRSSLYILLFSLLQGTNMFLNPATMENWDHLSSDPSVYCCSCHVCLYSAICSHEFLLYFDTQVESVMRDISTLDDPEWRQGWYSFCHGFSTSLTETRREIFDLLLIRPLHLCRL